MSDLFIKKLNIFGMNKEKLQDFFFSIGEKSFRASQIMRWIYQKLCDDFEKMTNIKKCLRKKLKDLTEIYIPNITDEYQSIDGTIKWITKVGNNQQKIETVYIPEKHRGTLCISSQLGCIVGCTFCFTSYQGFNKNLQVHEIICQVWNAIKIIKTKYVERHPITHIVFMGMGEPFLNLSNIVPSLEIIFDANGFNFSKRRVTISTSGIIPGFSSISKNKKIFGIKLAVSLHAPNNKIRNKIMPINRRYNLENLLLTIQNYCKKLGKNCRKFLTIEYVMLDQINDRKEHAYQLVSILKKIPCKINLIPWNIFPYAPYSKSKDEQILYFANILRQNNFITTIRKNRGIDISAACGQLSGYVLRKDTHDRFYSI